MPRIYNLSYDHSIPCHKFTVEETELNKIITHKQEYSERNCC